MAESANLTTRQADWPSATPRYLKPTLWGVGKSLLILLSLTAAGALVATHPQNPPDRAKGLLSAIFLGVLAIALLYNAITGRLNMQLEPQGLRIGKRYYAWGSITSGFTPGRGMRRQLITFTAAGKRATLANYYGMPTQALANLLNTYLPQTTSSQSLSPRARDDIAPAAKPRRNTLPPWAWVSILTLFSLIITNISPITLGLWSALAPASYARHMLNDQALADRAGFNPQLLPVLLERARKDDRSAMFFIGDTYDPTDFTGETDVPKNMATAIGWYRRAVALDDQGAERNLAILYHIGVGVNRNDFIAAALFERAVAKNDDLGDYYLGTMLVSGQGEPQNLPRAVALEQASAAQNQGLGEIELGRMYFYGIGLPPDRAKAAAEWKLAAAQGYTAAQILLNQNGL